MYLRCVKISSPHLSLGNSEVRARARLSPEDEGGGPGQGEDGVTSVPGVASGSGGHSPGEPGVLLIVCRTGEGKRVVSDTRFLFLHFLLGDGAPLVSLCCSSQGFKKQKDPCIFPCCYVFLL